MVCDVTSQRAGRQGPVSTPPHTPSPPHTPYSSNYTPSSNNTSSPNHTLSASTSPSGWNFLIAVGAPNVDGCEGQLEVYGHDGSLSRSIDDAGHGLGDGSSGTGSQRSKGGGGRRTSDAEDAMDECNDVGAVYVYCGMEVAMHDEIDRGDGMHDGGSGSGGLGPASTFTHGVMMRPVATVRPPLRSVGGPYLYECMYECMTV